MPETIRVFIIDDQSVVRLGLVEALRHAEGTEVVGESGDPAEALEKVRSLRPDVVTIDLQHARHDPIALIRELCRLDSPVKPVMLSVFEGEEDVHRAVEAGARGYLSKAVEIPELIDAIAVIATGGRYFSETIARKLAERRHRLELTPRELEVLGHIVSGRSNKEILSVMKVSEATVKLHISNMLAKLGVTDRTQAAIEAVRRGIVHLRS